MSVRRIFCEGPDDLSALRAYVSLRYRLSAQPSAPTNQVVLVAGDGTVELTLVAAGTRQKVLSVARQLIALDDSPSRPLERVGLCFDPDDQEEPGWRSWIERTFGRDGFRRDERGWQVNGVVGPVEVLAMPWAIAEKTHAGLAERHNLERVAARILATTHPERAALVDRWLDDVVGARLPADWKVAMRLWNALVDPDTSGRAFFDRVFGQNHALRAELERVIEGSQLGVALARLCT